MSSVTSSTDGGYQYQARKFEELEDELRSAQKRSEEKSEARVNKLEEQYKAQVAENEEDVRNYKSSIADSAQAVVRREKAAAREDVERIKRQTYDRWGRNPPGVDADALKAQLEQERARNTAQEAKVEREAKALDDRTNTKIGEMALNHVANLERTAEVARDSARETYHEVYERQRESYENERDTLRKRLGEVSGRLVDETEANKRDSHRMTEEVRRDYAHQMDKLQKAHEAQSLKVAEENHLRTAKQSGIERYGRDAENRALRAQVRDLIEAEGFYMKERGQAQKEVVQEFEDFHRGRQRAIVDGFEQSLAKEKTQSKAEMAFLAAQNHQNLVEKDRYFADVISRQISENRDMQREVQKTYAREQEAMERRLASDREQNRELLERTVHDASVERERSLLNQARAYQETITRTRSQMTEKERGLENQIKAQASSQESRSVPVAVEHSIQAPIVRHYSELLDAEQARHTAMGDSMQREFGERLTSEVVLNQEKVRDLTGRFTSEIDSERRGTQDMMRELQENHELALANLERQHDREIQNMNRNAAKALDGQRRQFEELLQNTSQEGLSRNGTLRQQYEFQAKNATRAFSQKQNELIRDYEKRLSEQKLQFDSQLAEVKEQADRTVRDTERKSKQMLEENTTNFQQRISDLEHQHKDRERVIAQNFDDNLDRIRRSNAELIKKKS